MTHFTFRALRSVSLSAATLFLIYAAPTPALAEQVSANKPGETADHSKFAILQQDFESGEDVTKACLTCHTEAGHQFMKSIHWTWEYDHPVTGQKLGKKTLINAFCGNAITNYGGCTTCHAGYGWNDDGPFDFTDETKIDCLVCHDNTGTYYRLPQGEGHDACSSMFLGKPPIDFAAVAQHVGMPERQNCGTCHFYGGGGDGVKHGDLDSSLVNPPRELDVHMSTDGANFACTACHITNEHIWSGSRYNVQATDEIGTGMPGFRRDDVATCESCHGTTPHNSNEMTGIKLNGHVNKVACQTCHIPEFSRGGVATKTYWDWRTAGKLDENGHPYKVEGYTQGNGKHRDSYISIKGDFTWDENVVPYYAWFDGVMEYTTVDTKIDPTQPVEINKFNGGPNDPNSRIWPFKRMHTVQPYDSGYNTLVYTHVWGKDDTAFWGNFKWPEAIEEGMRAGDKPYSGEFDFIDTYMYWPLAHMVAPSSEALDCAACHSKDGRLNDLKGFYMPGRDSLPWMDILGKLVLALALLGVLAHALLRIFLKKEEGHHE